MGIFLKRQTPPGKPLKKCASCGKWMGIDTFIFRGKTHDKCRACRKAPDKITARPNQNSVGLFT